MDDQDRMDKVKSVRNLYLRFNTDFQMIQLGPEATSRPIYETRLDMEDKVGRKLSQISGCRRTERWFRFPATESQTQKLGEQAREIVATPIRL